MMHGPINIRSKDFVWKVPGLNSEASLCDRFFVVLLRFFGLVFQNYVTIVFYIMVSNLPSIRRPTIRGSVSIVCSNSVFR